MENVFPTHLLDIVMISVAFSMITMVFIQKMKSLKICQKKSHLILADFILSLGVGVPFAMTFYNLGWQDAIWVGVFSFIGAPAIYDILRNQNILTYKPSSLSDTVSIPKENIIDRTDEKE